MTKKRKEDSVLSRGEVGDWLRTKEKGLSGCLFVHCWVAEQLLSTTDCSLVRGRRMLDKRSKQRRRVE